MLGRSPPVAVLSQTSLDERRTRRSNHLRAVAVPQMIAGTPIVLEGVMLRITVANERAESATLKVEGRITADWVELLEREIQTFLGQGKRLFLDFSAVTVIDSRAADMLKRLRVHDVEVVNCPSLLNLEEPDQ